MVKEKIETLLSELDSQELQSGLYIVATDIGNRYDISLRALSVLEKADIVVCEERKTGSKLLKSYGIKKQVETLNEHNEKERTKILIERLISDNISIALFSDAGTPLFADPGSYLVQQCHYYNVPVIPVPGASSLMAALMISGLQSTNKDFIYYDFLPANKLERINSLYQLRKLSHTNIVFLEAPYRLPSMLRDMGKALGEERKGIIAYKLTQPEEHLFSGNLKELMEMTVDLPKGEFVFILVAQPQKKKKPV